MSDNAPIGVFDSGLGGLSVWKELIKTLPRESVIYFGDGANCPYGPKSPWEVIAISEGIVRFLLSRGVKLIVVACNTATAAAIDHLRETFDIPFIGMEPAIKPAAVHSKTGVIGILATAATLEGKLFKETKERFSHEAKILSGIGEGFVELIENDRENSPEAEAAVRKCVEPMLEQGADHLVLGCTHYPFLTAALRKVIGERDVTLVDSAPAIARRTAEVLKTKGLAAAADHRPEYSFHTSADESYLGFLTRKAKIIAEDSVPGGENLTFVSDCPTRGQ